MARKRKPHGLKPGPADEIFQAILDWKNTENPSPETLIQWLTETSRIFTSTVNAFHSQIEMIKTLGEPERREAGSVVLNSLNYLDRAEVAGELLNGVVGGRVRDAFVEGLRIGLLYERILSHIDGRYTEMWRREDSRRRGAATTNKDHAEERAKYQAEVDRLQADEKISYSAASVKAAPFFGVSERTIRKYTSNSDPQNKGRHGRKPL